MAGTTIRMSARTVLEVLSGQTRQENYIRDNQMFSAQFDRFLREGRLLEQVSVEPCQDRDDDWMEFRFSAADPAIAKFSRGRSEPPSV